MQTVLTYLHISDSHIGPTPDTRIKTLPTLPYLERLVALINAFPQQPDFIVHTGDLSNDGSPESYAIAKACLATLKVPVYCVRGNRDKPAMLRQHMGAPPHPAGSDAPLTYTFEVKGERFLVLDTYWTPPPRGHIDAAQLARLQAECTTDGPPLTIFLHHPLFPLNSPWADENMLVDNGDMVHKALLPARNRLRGVFSGHLHHSLQFIRDGINYTTVSSNNAEQFAWHSWDETIRLDENAQPAYNVVQYFADYVQVTQRTFSL